jgi:hypothetical protein
MNQENIKHLKDRNERVAEQDLKQLRDEMKSTKQANGASKKADHPGDRSFKTGTSAQQALPPAIRRPKRWQRNIGKKIKLWGAKIEASPLEFSGHQLGSIVLARPAGSLAVAMLIGFVLGLLIG